ncbi:Hypothetical predicted protein [Scomber scombrus]|uniref:Uncharacterized protein n=1 Tax=Scomber scombrus TaxID=13677 RepID=A0AAV1MWT6_SCOSC
MSISQHEINSVAAGGPDATTGSATTSRCNCERVDAGTFLTLNASYNNTK